MKIHHRFIIVSSLLVFASVLPAVGQEANANPFIKKDVGKAPPKPPGAAFHDVFEYISIPSDVLNPWLEQHPVTEDAGELRKQVQVWIKEKKASMVHTLFTSGSVNREAKNQNIVEQIYPTEFMPAPAAETWLLPSAFETRNTGITAESSVDAEEEGRISAVTEWMNMLEPSLCYHSPTAATRQPGDMFMPHFWNFKVSQLDAAVAPPYVDPFGIDRQEKLRRWPSFAPGRTYLAGRVNLPAQDEAAVKSSLLVFFRGTIDAAPVPAAEKAEKAPAEHRISAQVLEMPQAEFSSWLLEQEPQAAASAAWAFASGRGTVAVDLSSIGRKGMRTDVWQIEEYIYPTEYEPAKDKTAKPEIPSTPTAFETRNLGNSLTTVLSEDARGLFLEAEVERVAKLSDTVMRRTQTARSEWIPDMIMPLFSSRVFSSTVRPQRGKWMLAASGPVFSPMGQPVMEKVSLVFLKVD